MHKYLSPAKLNLFLRIVGKRQDGYHLMQSVFTKIDLYDEIYISLNNNANINRVLNINNASDDIPLHLDLTVKSAKLMQNLCKDKSLGVDISLTKNIPMGAGLGGGSGNAATVMLALNKLLNINLSNQELQKLGLQLGADIPFFINESNSAWIEGIGENIEPINLPQYYFIIVKPNVHASTKEIFTSPLLIKGNPIIDNKKFIYSINNFYQMSNSLEIVTLNLFPEINNWLIKQNKEHNLIFQMTGSGSCFFCIFDNKIQRDEYMNKINILHNWQIFSANMA